jgi:hypothetical protein
MRYAVGKYKIIEIKLTIKQKEETFSILLKSINLIQLYKTTAGLNKLNVKRKGTVITKSDLRW